jgi:hypothetical protein
MDGGERMSVNEPALSHVPWSVTRPEFINTARDTGGEGACLVFLVADDIPATARAGYAQLIIAYARANEPVTIDRDGTAVLLITDGGVAAGRVVAERVFGLMRRISLESTVRAGVAPLGRDPEAAIAAARLRAQRAEPGGVVTDD